MQAAVPMPSRDPNEASSMRELQQRWYDFIVETLSLDPSTFQLFQPAGQIATTDTALWDAIDVVPPASLIVDRTRDNTERFSDQYAAMASQLAPPTGSLAQAIGEADERAWSAFLATLSPPPLPHQLAALFQTWAARHAMDKMPAGVAFFSRTALADREQVSEHGSADFRGGYADLLRLMQASPGRRGMFDSAVLRADPRGRRWAGIAAAQVDGLWTGSGGAPASRVFAESHVTTSIGFNACAAWTVTPGAWYSSSLLNKAFSAATSPPWRIGATPSWQDLFGPGGSMLRALASVLVVDGASIIISSDATFGASDQQAILDHAAGGLWPLYARAGDAVRSAVRFGPDGTMDIKIVATSGHPIVLGGNVLGIGRYLGHG
jgi:hypothetical protein